MGFFKKVKDKLGIGGVKIAINAPGQISKDEGKVTGQFTLTTKSDQDVKTMEVKLIEKYSTGRGEDKTTNEFTLGRQNFNEGFSIKEGEEKTFDFDFPFELLKSKNDKLKDAGGAIGAIGSVGKFANNEKSSYEIEVEVDVAAAALDPSESVNVKIV